MTVKKTAYLILSFFILVLTFTLCLSSELRDLVTKDLLNGDKRKILSVISITNDKKDFKVLKIQKGRHLFIEIYSDSKKEIFDLGTSNNGTVFLGDKSTELASVDIDNDGLQEIIVPTLNSRSKSALYILKYNSVAERYSMSDSVPYLNLSL